MDQKVPSLPVVWSSFRAWRDSREVGVLSREVPTQAALSLHGVEQTSSSRTFKDLLLSSGGGGGGCHAMVSSVPLPASGGAGADKRSYKDNIDDYYLSLSQRSQSNNSSDSNRIDEPKVKFNSNAILEKVLGYTHSYGYGFGSAGSSSDLIFSSDAFEHVYPTAQCFGAVSIAGSTVIANADNYSLPPPSSSSSSSSSSSRPVSMNNVAPLPSSNTVHDLTGQIDHSSSSYNSNNSNNNNNNKNHHSNTGSNSFSNSNSNSSSNIEQVSKKQAGGNSSNGTYVHATPSSNAISSNKFISGKPDQNSMYNRLMNNGNKRIDNNSNSNINSNSNDDITEYNDPAKTKYGFSSAKTIFVKDGGKFENNNNSSNNNSNRLNSNNSMSNIGKKLIKNNNSNNSNSNKGGKDGSGGDDELPEGLQGKGLDKALVDKIESDIIQNGQPVTFEQIAGLKTVKDIIQEIICWPMLRPDLFVGLRALPRGLLLFGPPGTGKTLIGKAVAHETGATFFSISASSLTSKWIGEGERTVKTLFAVAVYREPSVVFIDEVDSLLCQRSEGENEATRRMKTEIFIQLDGANTNADARVILIGATNRPDELDEAARRRFQKRIYIPLPDEDGRRQLFESQLDSNPHSLSRDDISDLVELTNGYSGADIRLLITEAAMGPMREMAFKYGNNVATIKASDIPSIGRKHFDDALENVAPSVSQADLLKYVEWNSIYGSSNRKKN